MERVERLKVERNTSLAEDQSVCLQACKPVSLLEKQNY